jgi:2-polyprenyl-3-methyl-5-hydroxy-6-metoxy-1,4-benzoquinol methylase
MPSYLSFARFYDGLMQDACYEKRCDYILKLAESFGHDMGITLDLACGTGTLTRLLKKRGVDVFGIDYKCSARQCKVPPKKGLISCF